MKGLCPNLDYRDGSKHKCYLNARGVRTLARRGVFFEVPKDQIDDKSKADALAKVLVCLQVTWTVVQVISKKAVRYPISLLEVHTLVHVVCALALYTLWFEKPMGVREPTFLDPEDFKEHLNESLAIVDSEALEDLDCPELFLGHYFRGIHHTFLVRHLQSHSSTPRKLALILTVVGGTGAMHILAWNFIFPSEVEKLLWRICSIATVAVPCSIIFAVFVGAFCPNPFLRSRYTRLSSYVKSLRSLASISFVCVIPAFVIPCRLFLIVESFISIRRVPIGVYVTVPWTEYIPHI